MSRLSLVRVAILSSSYGQLRTPMSKDMGMGLAQPPSFQLGSLLLVVNRERPDACEAAIQIQAWGEKHKVSVVQAEDMSSKGRVVSPDLVVSLGGDGTVLRAVQILGGQHVPVLGVNFGTLGYLTSVEPSQLLDVLESLRAGVVPLEARLENRMMLKIDVAQKDGGRHTLRALNEVVVEKVEPGHTVRLEVAIDTSVFATYSADGLIVATPTGSTAYSLSARGPVLSPQHRAMVLTPVSPHMLFDRSLVLDPAEEVSITVRGHRDVTLSVDGLHFLALCPGDEVRVASDAATACFMHVGQQRFHHILRQKFGLGDD
ncbi:MAG: NAD(+)/NADH kinase [Actinomycetes bacterium]